MSLDTLSNVKTRLGISGSGDDTLLGLLQASADKLIDNWCERDFEGGTFTEYFPGSAPFVFLRNHPVASLTSLKVDPARVFGAETVVSPTRYIVHGDRGVVQSVDGPFLPAARRGLSGRDIGGLSDAAGTVQIVYSVNADQVPADVKAAYALLIGHWYRRTKTETASNFLDVLQQKYGDTFVIYDRNANDAVPGEVAALLALHRVPRF